MGKSQAEEWAESVEGLRGTGAYEEAEDYGRAAARLEGIDMALEIAADYCADTDGFSGETLGECRTAQQLAMHLARFRRGK